MVTPWWHVRIMQHEWNKEFKNELNKTWNIKGQLDAIDWFFYCKTLFAQHVSGTIMPIIRSSRVIQTVAACGTWRFGLQVVGLVCSCGLCVRFAGCAHPTNRTHNPQLHTRPTTCKPKRHVQQAATVCITLELLMMGIMVPETCWANNKFCNKETNLLHLIGPLCSTY